MGDAKLQRADGSAELGNKLQHEDASDWENSLFICTWQGLARMFMMTWLLVCGNLQHRPFENQHQRKLTPKAQTHRSLCVALYHFIFFIKHTWCAWEHENPDSSSNRYPINKRWNAILMWLCRWQNCFFSVPLTSYLFCAGHPRISERPHPHLRPYMSGQQKKRGSF